MRAISLIMFALLTVSPAIAQPIPGQPAPALPGADVGPLGAPEPPARRATPHRTRQTMQQRFDAANTTRDGKLTLEQARAANMKGVVEHYDAIDASKKGYVTMDDIRAYGRARRAARRQTAH